MAKEAIGIYISSQYVDIVHLTGSTLLPRIQGFVRQEIVTLPASASMEEKPKIDDFSAKMTSHREGISAAIREGLKKIDLKSTNIYTVLPTSDVMIRYFSMPSIPKSERDQAVRFEVRKYIPFKIEKVTSDFKILQPHSKATRAMDVFFIAATNENLASHVDLFKNAGTDAVGVDIIPFALIKPLFLTRKISPKDNAAILYIDNDRASASIHIVEKGIPFLSRDIKITTDDKEAFFEKAASEIRVSLDYYNRQRSQADLAKVYICGEKIYDGLSEFIASELKLVTETHETFTGLRGAEKIPTSFIVAVGAALGGLGKSPYSVNLSPSAVVREKRKKINFLILEVIASLSIIIVTFLLNSLQTAVLLGEINKIRAQGKDLPLETSSLNSETLKAYYTKTVKEIGFLDLILNNRICWTKVLERVAEDMPKELWINKFIGNENFENRGEYPDAISRSVSISGSTFSPDAGNKDLEYINSFLAALKKDKALMKFFNNNIELGTVEVKKNRDYLVSSFEIKAENKISAEGIK